MLSVSVSVIGSCYPAAMNAPQRVRKPKTRANGEGSVYKLSDGRWRATKTAGFNAEGKQKIIAGTGRTREIAIERREAAWRKWLVASGQAPQSVLKKNPPVDKKHLTVADWFYRWHASFDPSRTKEHYRKQVLSRIELHIAPALGNTPLPLLSPDDIEKWVRKTLVDKKKAGSEEPLLTYGTIHNIFRTLHLGLSEAVKRGHIKVNPASAVTPPSKQKTRPEIERKKWVPLHLLKHLQGSEDEAFWLLKMLYGLRISEVLGLTDESFMLSTKNPRLIIRTQLKRRDVTHGCGVRNADGSFPCNQKTAGTCPQKKGETGWYLDDPKSEAGIRTLPLVEPALGVVRKHMKAQKALRESEEFKPLPGLETLVFTTPTGRPITPTTANDLWHELLEEAGVEYMRGHHMRHLTATLLAEAGVGLEVVKRILGHSEAAMSAYYTHVGEKATREPLEDLAKHLTQWQERGPGLPFGLEVGGRKLI